MPGTRIGLGDDLSDLLALATQDPTVNSVVQQVKQQAAAEGANTPQELDARLHTLASSYYNLISQEIGVDPKDALGAAQKYVHVAHTIQGAIENVEGLVQAAEAGAPPSQIVQSFTGLMIGTLVATGALTAGVGAAIVGAVVVVGMILDKLGLFGGHPSGTEVCPGITCDPAPKYVVNCICVYADPVTSPASPHWKHFPDPNNTDDVGWFKYETLVSWHGDTWLHNCGGMNGCKYRPIDTFGAWKWFECEQKLDGAGGDFQKMFWGAWKANQEMLLNGLKPIDDWKVLVNVLRIWNRAHSAGSDVTFQPTKAGDVSWPIYPGGGNCPGNAPAPYFTTLINAIINNMPQELVNGAFVIHGGPKKVIAPKAIGKSLHCALHPEACAAVGAIADLSTTSKPGAPMSTGAKVVIGIGVVGAAATGGLWWYAHRHHMTMMQAAKSLVPHRHPSPHALPPRRRRGREEVFENPPTLPPEGMQPEQFSRGTRKTSPRQPPKRRVSFRVRLDVSPAYESVVLFPNGTAILYRKRYPVVKFRPAPYQLGKIRHGEGELFIYADQILESLVGR